MVSSNIRTQGMDRATASSRIRIWATDRVTVSSPIRTQDMDRGTERVTVSRQHLKKRASALLWIVLAVIAGAVLLVTVPAFILFHAVNRTVQDTLTWNESSAEADRDGEDGSDDGGRYGGRRHRGGT